MYILCLFLLMPFIYYAVQIMNNNVPYLRTLTKLKKDRPSKCNMLLLLANLIYNYFKIVMIQKLNQNVIKIDKNKYIIQFTLEGSIFKKIVYVTDEVPTVLQVLDDDNNDVTHEIEPYFQNIKTLDNIKPKDLNYKKLIFETIMGEEQEFEADEYISFTETLELD